MKNDELFIEYHQYKSIFTSAEHFSSIRKVSDCVNSSRIQNRLYELHVAAVCICPPAWCTAFVHAI